MSYYDVEVELRGRNYQFEANDWDAILLLTELLNGNTAAFNQELENCKTQDEKIQKLSDVFLHQGNKASSRLEVASRIKEMIPDIDPKRVRCDRWEVEVEKEKRTMIDFAIRLDTKDFALLVSRILGLFKEEWDKLYAETVVEPLKEKATEEPPTVVSTEVVPEKIELVVKEQTPVIPKRRTLSRMRR